MTYERRAGISLPGQVVGSGQAVLVGGTVTVATPEALAGSKVFLTRAVAGGTAGDLRVGAITAGVSFVINSASVLDTSTVNWAVMS